jgi:hypothetical protein
MRIEWSDGAATPALNIAGPVTDGAYGRAVFDSVGPSLLIGWAETGPGMLPRRRGHPDLARPGSPHLDLTEGRRGKPGRRPFRPGHDDPGVLADARLRVVAPSEPQSKDTAERLARGETLQVLPVSWWLCAGKAALMYHAPGALYVLRGEEGGLAVAPPVDPFMGGAAVRHCGGVVRHDPVDCG